MYEKYKQLLDTHNIKSYKVSKDTGIAQATLSDWKRNKTTPKVDKLKILADYFGVPISYFLD